jgi:hypothetical protein
MGYYKHRVEIKTGEGPDDALIVGHLYIPDGDTELPCVVISHEFGFDQNHEIKYDVKVKNLLSPSIFSTSGRTYVGSRGVDLTKSYEYKIYVNKSDYEEAIALMNRSK